MSPFTAIIKETGWDYKNTEMSFEIYKNKIPYHAKSYRILVAQINLMKRAINVMVKKSVRRVQRKDCMGGAHL